MVTNPQEVAHSVERACASDDDDDGFSCRTDLTTVQVSNKPRRVTFSPTQTRTMSGRDDNDDEAASIEGNSRKSDVNKTVP